MTYRVSTGTYPNEIDISDRTAPSNPTIMAVVMAARRGSTEPKLITKGLEQWLSEYGSNDAGWSLAPYTMFPVLKTSTAIWARRVTNSALYGGTRYFADPANKRTLSQDFQYGAEKDYTFQNTELSTLSINKKLDTGMSLAVTLWDGVADTATTVTEVFDTDSNTTLDNLAQSIKDLLDTYGENGSAAAITETPGAGLPQGSVLTFTAPLVTGNTVQFSITSHGVTGTIGPVTFAVSNDATLEAIVTAINSSTVSGFLVAAVRTISASSGSSNRQIVLSASQDGLDSFSVSPITMGGGATATGEVTVEQVGTGLYDNRVVVITSPVGVDLTFTSPIVTGGNAGDRPTVTVSSSNSLLDIYAENPGEWSKDVGVKIANIDIGTNQVSALTFSKPLLAGGSFVGTLRDQNGAAIALGPISYTSNNDATLAAIATTINAAITGYYGTGHTGSATVVANPSVNQSLARTIVITAPNSLVSLSLTNASYSGSVANPSVSFKETLARTETDNSFELQVYTRDNIYRPVERYLVTLVENVNGSGAQTIVEEVVNESANKSSRIRVKLGLGALSLKFLTEDSTINWLRGGDDGILPTNSDIINAWQDFSDPEKITVRLLINGGYTDPSVHQAMTSLAANRKDCFAILDLPGDKQKTQDAYNHRKYGLNIDSSYGAIYTPDLKVLDTNTNRTLWVPPSGYVASRYAYTDRTRREWFAPAGLQRAVLENVLGLREIYAEPDRDILEPNGINPIIPKQGRFVIWGAETLQIRKSALSNVNVRRLNITIATAVTNALDFYAWEPNDPTTRFEVTQLLEGFFIPIKQGRGILEFEIVCDNRNNGAEAGVDGETLVVDAYYTPTLPAKNIRFNMIITKAGVSFSEYISSGGGAGLAG